MPIVTRFAPSPTGLLHIGGARTALYNYLFAKKNNGIFKLRIEDTDKLRSKEEYTKDILDSLKWLGLNWNEKIVFQSKNILSHVKLAERLLEGGNAYRCYATKEEIEKEREIAKKEKKPFKYNSKWRNFNKILEKPYVIRIRVPLNKKTILHDQILGRIEVNNNELDDFIILRSDKTPTYMLSVVVDDKMMGITDVIRGDDHLTNTFKQLILYDLLNWEKPRFSHIPLIHGQEGGKLSKRHGDLSINQYKKNKYIPSAVLNYLLKLGWGYGNKEIFTKEEAIKFFSLKGVGKSPAKFDEKKLENLNANYFKKLSILELERITAKIYKTKYYKESLFKELLILFQQRSENIKDFLKGLKYMLDDKSVILSEDAKNIIKNTNLKIKKLIFSKLSAIEQWDSSVIEETLKKIAQDNDMKLYNIASPVRAAITGLTHSPSIFKIVEILGKEKSLERIKNSF